LLLSSTPRPPSPTLFPYTTLFRSRPQDGVRADRLDRLRRAAGRAQALGLARSDRLAPDAGRFCLPAARLCREPLRARGRPGSPRSEEHTSELQSRENLVCRLLLEK